MAIISPQYTVNLIGSKNNTGGTKIGRIRQETSCSIHIDYNDQPSSPHNKTPDLFMTVTVTPLNPPTAQQDLTTARFKLEQLFLDYVGSDDGCKGRLLYELASSCWGPHRPKDSTSGAVKQRDPFKTDDPNYMVYMSVVDLPSKASSRKGERRSFHGKFLLAPLTLYRISQENGCRIKLCGDEFRIPVEYCDPYVLVMGKFWQNVDRAVDIVKEEIQRHLRQCTCSL